MIVDIDDDHVIVVSDLHIGSPASTATQRLPALLDHVIDRGANLCINGDGFDLLQGTWPRLFADGLPVLRRLRDLRARGHRVYYTLGNHDIAFEHLLSELPDLVVAPFLNLRSGDRRVRIEHGHLQEPFYARFPELYELGGRASRWLLLAGGDAYRGWSAAERWLDHRRRANADDYPYYRAAAALFGRGFDAVVFGHTHHPELTERPGGLFVNCGDWLTNGTYVEIDHGAISLHRWS